MTREELPPWDVLTILRRLRVPAVIGYSDKFEIADPVALKILKYSKGADGEKLGIYSVREQIGLEDTALDFEGPVLVLGGSGDPIPQDPDHHDRALTYARNLLQKAASAHPEFDKEMRACYEFINSSFIGPPGPFNRANITI